MSLGPTYPDQSEDGNGTNLASLVDEYKRLLEEQALERQELLNRVEDLTNKTSSVEHLDTKIENLKLLLNDIKEQLVSLSTETRLTVKPDGTITTTEPAKPKSVPQINPLVDKDHLENAKEEVEQATSEMKRKSTSIDVEIQTLTGLLEGKKQELKQKDQFIEQLNSRLEGLTDEKERLIKQLDSLNDVMDSWKNQLDLLQKLAATDPRYKVIGALKKHGSLSEIQLAFTMGTSISQIRRYIEALLELGLVVKDASNRYVWVGKEAEEE